MEHPGGERQTRRLIDRAGIKPPARVLDMGAGGGSAVRLLRALGFDAYGIDLNPGADVERGDFLHCPWRDGAFDVIFSECALFVSGDRPRALREARRLVGESGLLLCADVWPADLTAVRSDLEGAGWDVFALVDETAAWRSYYLDRVWDGTADELRACRRSLAFAGGCRYLLTACQARTPRANEAKG